MTCENCYHYNACAYFLRKENKRLGSAEGFICEHFKDKSLIVELPCRVGDILWTHSSITGKPISFTVPDIHWIIDADNFGKDVFLTREEAERASEEREKNEK